jgi:hypothetical protein
VVVEAAAVVAMLALVVSALAVSAAEETSSL